MEIFKNNKKVPEEQWHPKFKLLKENSALIHEKEIVEEWTEGMIDKDNNMVQKFQKTFHSCFWEFYLFACFKEMGFGLDQTHNRPDFMIVNPYKINIEAVTANIKQGGRAETDRNANDMMDMFIPPKNQKDYYEVQYEAIARQSNAIVSKANKYNKEYQECSWVDKDVPFVIALSSYGQVNYGREYIYPMMTLLYGLEYIPEEDCYHRVKDVPKLGTGVKIPVGLFCSEQYSNISAIIYSCTTTMGKLTALSKSAGNFSYTEVINLRRDFQDEKYPYKLHIVDADEPETLTDGLFIFHNPYAKVKIPIEVFENTDITQFCWKNETLLHTVNTYPIVCRLNYPRILKEGYELLISEYFRQYNNIPPIEYYSINSKREREVDFNQECIVCIWIDAKGVLGLRNINYIRDKNITDRVLTQEATYEVEKLKSQVPPIYGTIVRIDIIRTKEQYEVANCE